MDRLAEKKHYLRLIGMSHGYVHAICAVKQQMGHLRWERDMHHSRHVRLRKPYQDRIDALQNLYERLEPELRIIQAAYKELEHT